MLAFLLFSVDAIVKIVKILELVKFSHKPLRPTGIFIHTGGLLLTVTSEDSWLHWILLWGFHGKWCEYNTAPFLLIQIFLNHITKLA